jgi:hypothetical protein
VSLLQFFEWLAETPGSIAIRESMYMYTVLESIHVWGLALFVGFTALLDLRLLGWAMRDLPISQSARRFFPLMVAGFVVMVISGVLLLYAIPVRTYHSVFFRVKLLFLIAAGLNAGVFHLTIWRRVAEWDVATVTPTRARVAGAMSLVLWTCIIFSGRMIAYNWFDCDRQPQPHIVNWAAGCVIDPEASDAASPEAE